MATTIIPSTDSVHCIRTGGWASYASGANSGYGGEDYYYVMYSSGAGDTCTWTFTGLTPGENYWIAMTWMGAPGRATDVPWTISDGSGTAPWAYSARFPSLLAPTPGTSTFNSWARSSVAIWNQHKSYPRDYRRWYQWVRDRGCSVDPAGDRSGHLRFSGLWRLGDGRQLGTRRSAGHGKRRHHQPGDDEQHQPYDWCWPGNRGPASDQYYQRRLDHTDGRHLDGAG